MGYTPDSTLYDVLFATAANTKAALPDPGREGHPNATPRSSARVVPGEGALRGVRGLGRGHGHDLAPFDRYLADDVRGLRWPVVDGKETLWRFNEAYDPYAEEGQRFDFYGRRMRPLPKGDLDKPAGTEKIASPVKPRSSFDRTRAGRGPPTPL